MRREAKGLRMGVALLLICGVVALVSPGVPRVSRAGSDVAAGPGDRGLAETLVAAGARVAYHAKTGKVRFIGFDPGSALSVGASTLSGAEPEEVARSFVSEYGSLFGLADPTADLTVMVKESDPLGGGMVRFQQRPGGLPVFGGELIVNTDAARQVVSATGEVLPVVAIDTEPTVAATDAARQARDYVARTLATDPARLTTTQPELWIYNPMLVGAPGPEVTTLVWRLDVRAGGSEPIDELVLVHARAGGVVLSFSQLGTARAREIYDANSGSTIPTTPTRSEGGPATGIADVDQAYTYLGHIYDLYSTLGRDSIDNRGLTLRATVRYCPQGLPCPFYNAYYHGVAKAFFFGEGFAASDDVVGHEYTHGVTASTARLFYYMQSGAVNEAFSDVMGELSEITAKPAGDRTGRWMIGEDLPAVAPRRSMSNPPANNQPAMTSSSLFYCGDQDSGGVHTNNSIGNKAAYLMTDGDTFNGQTVTGIGPEKVARIWYRTQSTKLTSASDYQDLSTGVYQSCTELMVGGTTTAGDCAQVRAALVAVEMDAQPVSCAPAKPPTVCPVGRSPRTLYFNDMETSIAEWIGGPEPGYEGGEVGLSTYYATSGSRSLFIDDPATVSYTRLVLNRAISVPAGSETYLRFNHAYDLEGTATGADILDGGQVRYSVDGGETWTNATSLFVATGYTGTVLASGSPMVGRPAFGHWSYGYGTSVIRLSSLGGQDVRLGYWVATDSANRRYQYGWYLDDVWVYACEVTATPTPWARAADHYVASLITRLLAPTSTPTPTATPTTTPSAGG